jgi:hypothetical protein
MQHRSTKHIEIGIHFVREKEAVGVVRFLHVSSSSEFADIFHKGLHTALFQEFRTSLHVDTSPRTDCGSVLGGFSRPYHVGSSAVSLGS